LVSAKRVVSITSKLMGTVSMQRRNRIGWIEWARVLGAVGVVVLHVLTSSFMKVPEDISDVRLAGYIVVSVVFGRWAVPSFFMIT
jgi:surface polysaccharide O-acyltransferase-like enzyme